MRMLCGDSPTQDYENFMLETINILEKHKVKGIAVVAFIDDPNSEALTAYWNMGCIEKSYAATHIQSDAVDELVMANMDRYLRLIQGENDDFPEEE